MQNEQGENAETGWKLPRAWGIAIHVATPTARLAALLGYVFGKNDPSSKEAYFANLWKRTFTTASRRTTQVLMRIAIGSIQHRAVDRDFAHATIEGPEGLRRSQWPDNQLVQGNERFTAKSLACNTQA